MTIPRDVRRALHLRPGNKLVFDTETEGRAVVRKASARGLLAVLDQLAPTGESGLEMQRRLRRKWLHRGRRH